MTPADLKSALNWRYATKKFDDRAIPGDAWDALLDSLHLAPSSFGLQPWRFIVVNDPDLRSRLKDNSWGQPQLTEAAKLVVITCRTDLTPEHTGRWIKRLAEVQQQDPADLEGLGGVITGFCQTMSPEDRHSWNVRQGYIALGQFMSSAAMLRIDTCPLEGIDPGGYDRELGLEGSGFATAVACVAGYRADSDASATRPKARFLKEEIIVER